MESLTIVSNRLPIVVKPRAPDQPHEQEQSFDIEPAAGGLVQALGPILARRGGRWIGWPGIVTEDCEHPGELVQQIAGKQGYELAPVLLNRAEVNNYYAGFANSIMWPLFHGLAGRCDFREEFWRHYLEVNDKFADVLSAHAGPSEELIWVHDYHLIPVAHRFRAAHPRRRARIGFFLHIPFPALQIYVVLPWRAELLRAFLAYDLLGFQTSRDLRNFLECVERLMPSVRVIEGGSLTCIQANGRRIWAGVFPIGTDAVEFSRLAQSGAVAEKMRSLRTAIGPCEIILGVDRLDYTKGLIERLHALDRALEVYPGLREKVVLFQLVIPSREDVPEYQTLKRDVDRMVGYLNGRYSTASWSPVRYLYNTVDKAELTALYRMAAVALVTPLCDGMNLVAKEFVSAQVDESGVLILGEMAGAAAQLAEGALLVNPHDVNGMADAIYQAVNMSPAERRGRMHKMRQVVSNTDVYWWANSFVDALREPQRIEIEMDEVEYLPTIELDACCS